MIEKILQETECDILVNDMGWDKFQNLVLKERAIVRATQSVITQLEVDHTPNVIKRPIRISDENGGETIPDGYARWLKTNTVNKLKKVIIQYFLHLKQVILLQANYMHSDIIRNFSSEGKGRSGFEQNIAYDMYMRMIYPRLYSKLLEVDWQNLVL